MAKSWEEYKATIIRTEDYIPAIEEARKEYGIPASAPQIKFTGENIAINLEREFIDCLLDEGRISEAERVLARMKASYTSGVMHNILESYEYRIQLIKKTGELMERRIVEAKKEFNQHTIVLISIVVGVITILGTANQSLSGIRTPNQAFGLFAAVVLAVIVITAIALLFNKKI